MKKYYLGNHISISSMPTAVAMSNGKIVNGDMIYIADKDGNIALGGPAIWLMEQNNNFQNLDNFFKGVELIDKYANSGRRYKCNEVLYRLTNTGNKGSDWYCKMIAFFCEVGIWENKELRNPNLYNTDIAVYIKNVMWNYYME